MTDAAPADCNHLHAMRKVLDHNRAELDPAETWLTAREVAAMAGISVEALKARRLRGHAPPATRVGHRTYLFARSAVMAWLAEKGKP